MKLTSRLWMGLGAVVLTLSSFESRCMDKGGSAEDGDKPVRPKSAKGHQRPDGVAAGAPRALNVSPEEAAGTLRQPVQLSEDILKALIEGSAQRDLFMSQLVKKIAALGAEDSSGVSRNPEVIFVPSPLLTGYVKHPDGSFSCSIGGRIDRRALAQYEQYPQIPGLDTSKRAIVGGAHLTPHEVFELNDASAKKGESSSFFFEPVGHMNTGCIVFNIDAATRPDHMENFTEPGVISKLGLERRFNNVTFENVTPSLTFNEEALRNAYSALEPGGVLYAFPIPNMEAATKELQRRIEGIGFEEVKFSSKSHYFLTHKPPLDIGSVMARKPKGEL